MGRLVGGVVGRVVGGVVGGVVGRGAVLECIHTYIPLITQLEFASPG